MNKHTRTAGQALVRLLANYGVETVFGILACTPRSCIVGCRAAASAMY